MDYPTLLHHLAHHLPVHGVPEIVAWFVADHLDLSTLPPATLRAVERTFVCRTVTETATETRLFSNLHSVGDEPALIWAYGACEWWKNGVRHRDGDEPAMIWPDGTREWWKNGQRHRDGDETAVILANGTCSWWKNGQRHRSGDEPAMICASGRHEWWKNGQRHRDGDKPAVIWPDGSREWCKNGMRVLYAMQ